MMTRRRALLLGIVLLTVVQCGIWYIAAGIAWATRYLMVGPSSAEAASRTRFALVVFACLAVNLIALVTFILRRHGSGGLVLVVVQIADLIFTTAAAITIDAAWWLLSGAAALTLPLLFLLRRLYARLPSHHQMVQPVLRQIRGTAA